MSQPTVRLRDVSFTYDPDVAAIRDLSLELYPGDILAVFGANGAGKSTLCYLLSGIIPNIWGGTRTGELEVFGEDPWGHPIHHSARNRSIVLQDPEAQLFMPNLQLELAFAPANFGLPRAEILDRLAWALKTVGLEGLENRNPKALSGGQKQRAALASALTMLPGLLILDEPTSQLDPLGSEGVLEALRAVVAKQDLTTVITTHKVGEVEELANRALVLDQGRAVLYGELDEVLDQVDRLEQAGVQPPALRRFFHLVAPGRTDLAVTPEAAAEQVRKLVAEGRLQVSPRPATPTGAAPPAERAPVLQIEGLSFSYPGHPPVVAVRDVDLTIGEREFVAILGQNGSGKTTLVKCIVGLNRPQRGKIRFRGESIAGMSVGQVATRIGLVLQNPDYQLFSVSARAEVAFGLENLGRRPEEALVQAEAALVRLGLEEHGETFPFRLSFGDRRKLAVAAAVAMGPEVLILDEPTTAQDYRGRYQLADLAREMRDREGRTIIMISHDMDLVARYAERVILMLDGRIILDAPSADVFDELEVLTSTFLKPPDSALLGRSLADLGVPRGTLTPEQLADVFRPTVGVR
ncbi:MAG TPA: energy-coupling factor transporter ATPase [Bacillota bacterium]|nr:energy-coupling factor transporter ATPase [Bacillota bacterium]